QPERGSPIPGPSRCRPPCCPPDLASPVLNRRGACRYGEARGLTAYYVGLDVHSRESVFVIQDDAARVGARGAVPTTPEGCARLCREHQLPPGTAVGLETGTAAFYVARELAALQLAPIVVDAHEVRRKAHRPAQKSDRRDAFEVCDGIRRDLYRSIVHI